MLKKVLRKALKINTGLLPLKEDERDLGFSFDSILRSSYQPKEIRKKLGLPFAAKAQRFNTCGWR